MVGGGDDLCYRPADWPEGSPSTTCAARSAQSPVLLDFDLRAWKIPEAGPNSAPGLSCPSVPRDWQYRTSQFLQGKTFDKATPFGPWLVTRDDPSVDERGMHMSCEVDGGRSSRRQHLRPPFRRQDAGLLHLPRYEPASRRRHRYRYAGRFGSLAPAAQVPRRRQLARDPHRRLGRVPQPLPARTVRFVAVLNPARPVRRLRQTSRRRAPPTPASAAAFSCLRAFRP